MSVFSPSALARNSTQAVLQNSTTGFNAAYASAQPNYAGAPDMNINFAATPQNKNFFLGDIDPEAIESTGTFTYPLLTLFSIAGASRNWQKHQRWSGLVSVGARFFLSGGPYKSSNLLQNYEAWPDCVEDAAVQCMQQPITSIWPSTAAYSVLYNGEMSVDRKFPIEAGTNWMQVLSFKFTFELVIA